MDAALRRPQRGALPTRRLTRRGPCVDLYAQPFAADFDGDGNADIGVWTPGLGRGIFEYATGLGSLGRRADRATGIFDTATAMAVFPVRPCTSGSWPLRRKPLAGDFNGDDLGDIGVWNSDGTWKVRYGDGSGQFDNETVYSWAGMPTGEPFAADFDGDGNTDIGVWTPDDEDGDINDGDDAWTINYLLRAADSRAVVTSPSPQAQGSIDAVGLTVGARGLARGLVGVLLACAELYGGLERHCRCPGAGDRQPSDDRAGGRRCGHDHRDRGKRRHHDHGHADHSSDGSGGFRPAGASGRRQAARAERGVDQPDHRQRQAGHADRQR